MGNTAKKVGFISVIMTIVGSSIGAGIFFKNGSILANTNGSIGLTISCWVVAAIGILAIGLALMEVTSTQERDKGILGWVEKFAPKWIFKWSKGYMLLLYFPITFVTMPIYAVLALQDAAGWSLQWWVIMLIAVSILFWIATISFLSLRAGNSLQWFFTIIKFIPIIIIPLFGFINYNNHVVQVDPNAKVTGLTGMFPYLGVVASIPAIFFAYDGFYSVSSLKEQMKKPKLMPLAIAIGIGIITSVYLLITAGVLVGSKHGAKEVFENRAFRAIMNTCIFIAVIGVINGFSLGTYNIYDEYIKDDDFAFSSFFKKWKTNDIKIGKKTLRGLTPGFCVLMTFSFILMIILCVFGALVYKTSGTPINPKASSMVALTDLLTNWTSLLAFVIIASAIGGALVNRKTNKVEVQKSKIFIPSAIVSIALTTIPMAYMIIASMVDMSGYNHANISVAITTFSVLILTIIVSFVPWIIEILLDKKQKSKENTSTQVE